MSTKQVVEQARPHRRFRDKPKEFDQETTKPPDGLYRLPVRETQNQRNAGTSIVQEKLNQGWVKSDDPGDTSEDGNSHVLLMDWEDVMAWRKENNELAHRQEGFLEHEVLQGITREDSKTTGKQLEADLPERAPNDNPDNG